MTSTTAAIVEAAGAAFTLAEVELDEPRPGEVLVRMVAAGLCHTDLGVAVGALPFPLPGVLGHEVSGIVEAIGPGVRDLQKGDHVAITIEPIGTLENPVE